jgi:hypothetical protein
LEDLSDASFLGKLLVLPANVRLDWKVFARCKHSSLYGLVISNEEKSFIKLTPDDLNKIAINNCKVYFSKKSNGLFVLQSYQPRANVINLFKAVSLVYCLRARPTAYQRVEHLNGVSLG